MDEMIMKGKILSPDSQLIVQGNVTRSVLKISM